MRRGGEVMKWQRRRDPAVPAAGLLGPLLPQRLCLALARDFAAIRMPNP